MKIYFIQVCEMRDTQSFLLNKKWIVLLRISSVNMTKSAVYCGFAHIYSRNSSGKLPYFCRIFTVFDGLYQKFNSSFNHRNQVSMYYMWNINIKGLTNSLGGGGKQTILLSFLL